MCIQNPIIMADNNKEDIILNIQVRNSDAIIAINEYNQANYNLKKLNKELNDQNKELEKSTKDLSKQVKDQTGNWQEAKIKIVENNASIRQNIEHITKNTQEITANNNASRVYQRELQNNIKEEQANAGSLVQLKAQLSNATTAFDRLAETERNGAKGKELQTHINEITDSLKEAEEGTQRYYRNVGNYEEAIANAAAGGNTFALTLINVVQQGNSAGQVIDLLKTKVKAFFSALMANPAIAMLAGMVVVLMAIKKAIDSSEESTAKFNKILAPLNALLDGLLWVIQEVVGFFLDGVLAVQKFTTGLAKLMESLPLVGGLFKEVNKHIENSIELEQRKADLEKRTRVVQEQNAKYSRDIAKLRAESEDKLKYTAEERLEFIRQANKLEKQSADNALAIAKEKLAIAELEAGRKKMTTEKEKELSNLRAEVYKAEEAHFNKLRELQGKERALLDEQANAEKERLDKAKAKAKEYANKQKEIREKELAATIEIQNLKYDAEIKGQKAIADNQEKTASERLQATLKANAKEIEAVKYNQDQELKQAGLTAMQKELINVKANQRLLELQKELSDNMLKLTKDEETKRLEVLKTNIDNRLATVKQGSLEELNFRILQLDLLEKAEIASAEKTGADVAAIREKYRQLEVQEQEKQEAYLSSQKQTEFQNKILEAQLQGENTLAIQIEQKTAQLEALSQLEGESDINFYNRKLVLQNELKGIEDEYLNYQLETRVQVMQATSTIAAGFQDLFESMAEDNATFATFAKAMALYQIGVDTATALTAGIKQAQSIPFPGNIPAIATTIATILSSIAKAKKFLTSSNEPKAPKFNQGGLVTGSGSGTSDSIRAYLSNGESVMTARTTSMFAPVLSAFNQIGGGVPLSTQDTAGQIMGEEMLSRSFAKAVATLPSPVVSVQEIDNVNNRIGVLESSRNI